MTDRLAIAIKAVQDAVRRKTTTEPHDLDGPRPRWMAAVLVRKADLRELLKALKGKD